MGTIMNFGWKRDQKIQNPIINTAQCHLHQVHWTLP